MNNTKLQELVNECAEAIRKEIETSLRDGHDVDGVNMLQTLTVDGVTIAQNVENPKQFQLLLSFESEEIAEYMYNPQLLHAQLREAEKRVASLKQQLFIKH